MRYQLDPFIIQGTQNPPFVAKSQWCQVLDGTVPPAEQARDLDIQRSGEPIHAEIPNNWQWNFTLSRELFRNNTMQLSYVGNRGNHLQDYTDVAQITPVPGNPVSTAG